MSIFKKITREIHSGMVMYTPVRRAQFTVDSIDVEKGMVVFSVGAKTRIKIPRACWDGIPNFLRGKDWVKIGSRHDSARGTISGWQFRGLNGKEMKRMTWKTDVDP